MAGKRTRQRQRPDGLIDNLKFKYKMIALSTAVILLVGGISIIGYRLSLGQYNRLLYRQTSQSLSLYGRQIRSEMAAAEEYSNMAAINPELQSHLMALAQPDSGEMQRYQARSGIVQSLYRYLQPEILCITILQEDAAPIICGLDSSPEQPHILEEAKRVSREKNGAGFWMPSGRDDGTVLFVREMRKTEDPWFLKSLGYLIFRVDYNRLVAQAGRDVAMIDDQLLAVMDGAHNLFFTNTDPAVAESELVSLEIDREQGYSISQVGGELLFLGRTGLRGTDPDLYIVSGLPYDRVFSAMIRTNVTTLTVMALAILLAIVAAGLAVRSIDKRFALLVGKINRFKSGNLEPLPGEGPYGKDEFGLLNQYFDELTIELKGMIEENYIKELLIAQAKLKNLKHQINPHFLYNTLESINWLAKRCGERQIPVVIDALSNLLRSNLEEGADVVTLEQELGILAHYITIQKVRHTDMLEVEYRIDPRTLGAAIPKMSIQPLVENAISYSMEESIDGCRIVIASRAEADTIVVSVENNGSQIDEDILERLASNTIQAGGHGIGLTNIDSRLRLIFGEAYGLRFLNGDDTVTVEIVLPKEPDGSGKGGGEACSVC